MDIFIESKASREELIESYSTSEGTDVERAYETTCILKTNQAIRQAVMSTGGKQMIMIDTFIQCETTREELIEIHHNLVGETKEEREYEVISFMKCNYALRVADELVKYVQRREYNKIKVILDKLLKIDINVFKIKCFSDAINKRYLENSYNLSDRLLVAVENKFTIDDLISDISLYQY